MTKMLEPDAAAATPVSKPGSLARIAVPQSAAIHVPDRPELIIRSVVDFVNLMLDDCFYRRDELPINAMRAYHVDYYLAQVNNGGHSQFIHNSGLDEHICGDIEAGLTEMGANAYLSLFTAMMAWAQADPKAASEQTGFAGGRSEHLDHLDARFHALSKPSPLVQLIGRWLGNLPELQAVPDDDYQQSLAIAAQLNPHRTERIVARHIGAIDNMLQDRLHVAMGMAATACDPIDAVLKLGGGTAEEVEGRSETVWRVFTNSGIRFGVFNDDGASLYECIEHDNPEMPAPGDAEGMIEAMNDGRFDGWRKPELGRKLSHVSVSEIEEAISFCKAVDAGAAIDRLLRGLDGDSNLAYISLRDIEHDPITGANAAYIVICAEAAYAVVIGRSEAFLRSEPDHGLLAKITRGDIELHASRRNA